MKCIIIPRYEMCNYSYRIRKREAGLNRTENVNDETVYTQVKMGREYTGGINEGL